MDLSYPIFDRESPRLDKAVAAILAQYTDPASGEVKRKLVGTIDRPCTLDMHAVLKPAPEDLQFSKEVLHELYHEPLHPDEVAYFRTAVKFYEPEERFSEEWYRERDRIERKLKEHQDQNLPSPKNEFPPLGFDIFATVIKARCAIRKRWEELGIWNESWGIPGKTTGKPNARQPNERLQQWQWPWVTSARTRMNHLDEQWPAVESQDERALREYLQEKNLWPDTYPQHEFPPADDKDRFITSRPWYRWKLETIEERIRLHRLSKFTCMASLIESLENVKKTWQADGRWKDSWGTIQGWRWPHERAASPEPKDPHSLDFDPAEAEALSDLAAYHRQYPHYNKNPYLTGGERGRFEDKGLFSRIERPSIRQENSAIIEAREARDGNRRRQRRGSGAAEVAIADLDRQRGRSGRRSTREDTEQRVRDGRVRRRRNRRPRRKRPGSGEEKI